MSNELPKSCNINLYKDHFTLICNHPIAVGGYIGSEPRIKVDRATATPTVLGEKVMEILAVPQMLLSVPVDFKSIRESALKFEGFKSEGACFKATISVCCIRTISEKELRITPYPTRKSGGFLPDTSKRVICDYSAEGIGKALFQAFELA